MLCARPTVSTAERNIRRGSIFIGYSESGNIVDILVMLAFGALRYVMRKLDFEPAPWCWPSS
jgi:TctA family transporter